MSRFRRYLGKKKRRTRVIPVRAPVPLRLGLPSIAQLPDEVVLLILSFVDDDTSQKIASLSSSLYVSSRRAQHRTMFVDLSEGRQKRSRLRILTRNLLLPAVQVLMVNTDRMKNNQESDPFGSVANYLPKDDIMDHVADAVSGMTGLRDLHWQCSVPIPSTLVQRIPSQTRLHADLYAPRHDVDQQEQVRNYFAQLYENQNLFSLSVHIKYRDEQKCRVTMQTLKRVLLSYPKLARIPQLFVGPVQNFICGVGDGPLPGAVYCGLGLCRGEKPPALEELGVESFFSYPWGHEQTFAIGLNGIYCIGYPERGSEVQYWAHNFDWSQLRKLNCIPRDLALEIAPRLTCLKEVNFGKGNWDHLTFLEAIPTALETLTIPSRYHISNRLYPIIRHGGTLRELAIHGEGHKFDADHCIKDPDLSALCDALPHLVSITLDISRNLEGKAWPYSSLDIIARFPRLRNIKLWFQLGQSASSPHLTVSEARGLFHYLHNAAIASNLYSSVQAPRIKLDIIEDPIGCPRIRFTSSAKCRCMMVM